jgi:hypothetical protein
MAAAKLASTKAIATWLLSSCSMQDKLRTGSIPTQPHSVQLLSCKLLTYYSVLCADRLHMPYARTLAAATASAPCAAL